MPDQPSQYFPTTSLSMVAAAKSPDGAEHAAAMKRLAAGYWKPVFYFLRARGQRWQHAEDLTQEFFVKLLERDWIARFDPARGRFRTFLLAVLERFVIDQGPRASRGSSTSAWHACGNCGQTARMSTARSAARPTTWHRSKPAARPTG